MNTTSSRAEPGGAGGRLPSHAPFSHAVMGYSKNQKLAKDFLRWLHGKEQFEQWFVAQKGFSVGSTTDWEKHKMWGDRPGHCCRTARRRARSPLRVRGTARTRRVRGRVEVHHHRHVRQAIQGMKPEDSLHWAESELKKIYA